MVTGPVFLDNLSTIGKDSITIPGYFYKVLLRREENKFYTMAIMLPQLGTSNDFRTYVIPVNALESITGIDFFPALDNHIENRVEAQYQPNKWGL